jgi:putative transposase
MPRANRYFLPGHVWHITHRCHKREFLLKFSRDRQNWLKWLFEARKRHDLQILNYTVTSNHIHLLVFSEEDTTALPRSIQLVAGRTAQDYNQRKKRKGAFWEDRYHATAVDTDEHLLRCMLYIDLNMVRAGVVEHPRQWPFTGYHEITSPPERYRLINRKKLLELLEHTDETTLARDYASWIDDALGCSRMRDPDWTDSIAVGTRTFVESIQMKLESKATGRRVIENDTNQFSVLREDPDSYDAHLGGEIGILRQKNGLFWDISSGNSEY